MTKTENTEATCYFCQGIATAIKEDVTLESTEAEDIEVVELLPICEACNAHWYDGTEERPALLPLA